MITIVVGNGEDFLQWCKENGVKVPPCADARHLPSFEHINGLMSSVKHRVVLLKSAFPCAVEHLKLRGFNVAEPAHWELPKSYG